VPPILYIPVADDVAEAVTKSSEALEYKLELPSVIKISHAHGKTETQKRSLNI